MTEYKEVTTTQHEQGSGQRTTTFKATQLVWLLFVRAARGFDSSKDFV